jgi:hypothetical protein
VLADEPASFAERSRLRTASAHYQTSYEPGTFVAQSTCRAPDGATFETMIQRSADTSRAIRLACVAASTPSLTRTAILSAILILGGCKLHRLRSIFMSQCPQCPPWILMSILPMRRIKLRALSQRSKAEDRRLPSQSRKISQRRTRKEQSCKRSRQLAISGRFGGRAKRRRTSRFLYARLPVRHLPGRSASGCSAC